MKYQDRKEATEKFALKGISYSIGIVILLLLITFLLK